MGYGFYINNVPADEQPMLIELNRAGFRAFDDVPMADRRRCVMSYDFHIITSERPLLINHKITPLVLTADGRAWLALCTVSLSSHKEAGQILFRILGQSGYRQYSLTAHRWQPCEGVTLTPEEKQVLTLSAQGYTMKEISDHICRSFDTVKFYRRQLFEKLDVANITEAIAFATNYGLL